MVPAAILSYGRFLSDRVFQTLFSQFGDGNSSDVQIPDVLGVPPRGRLLVHRTAASYIAVLWGQETPVRMNILFLHPCKEYTDEEETVRVVWRGRTHDITVSPAAEGRFMADPRPVRPDTKLSLSA